MLNGNVEAAMNTRIGRSIAVLIVLLTLGCSEKPSVHESKDRTEPTGGSVIRIVFDLPGDDIGSQEYRTILNALNDAIYSNKAGEVTSSGFGMGNMEIVVAINVKESTAVIQRIVAEVYPKAKYRIEYGTR